MDLVGLVSGGKDSVYNLLAATRLGHRVVCLANLHPAPAAATIDSSGDAAAGGGAAAAPEELDSFMFQTVGHTAIADVAECMGLPLVRRTTAGHSAHRGLHYPADAATAAAASAAAAVVVDEVEDLHALLADVVAAYPSVRGVGVGAILSSYQRLRVEAVCARLGLVPVALLWQRRQGGLLRDMVDAGVDAVLVKVASLGLTPRMLGQPLGALQPQLHGLHRRFGLNVCGEGGEYETITRHCPGLYAHGRLVVDDADVERPSPDVAHWAIRRCHVEKADEAAVVADAASAAAVALPAPLVGAGRRAGPVAVTPEAAAAASAAVEAALAATGGAMQPAQPPPVRAVGAYVHVGGLTAAHPLVRALVAAQLLMDGDAALRAAAAAAGDASLPPAQRAASEVHVLFAALRVLLASHGASLADVAFVHLYLSDMGLFGPVNGAYCEYFGEQPPSRSTVAVARLGAAQQSPAAGGGAPSLPQPAVLLDCVALARSGAALRSPDGGAGGGGGDHPPLPRRSTLHVQSLSHWAPLCIGPYCQANTLGGGGGGSSGSSALVLAAGSIGMVPHTMALVASSPALVAAAPSHAALLAQGHQALLNVARVLAAVDSGLPRALAVTVYVAAPYAATTAAAGGGANTQVGDDGAAGTGVGAMTALVRAWVCGLQGRGRPPMHAAAGAGASNDHDNDAGSDGTFSPPGSEDGDGSDGDSCREDDVADAAPTAQDDDPCRERDFCLGPHAHVPPAYLPLPQENDDDAGAPARRRALRVLLADAPPAVPPAAAATDPCLAGLPALPQALAAALPVRTVVVPALPRGAAVEVEVVSSVGHAACGRCWRDEVAEGGGAVTVSGACYYAADGSPEDGAVTPTAAASAFVDVTCNGDVAGNNDNAAAASAASTAAAACRMAARAVAHGGLSPSAHTLHVRAYVAAAIDGIASVQSALQRAVAAEMGGGSSGAPPPAVTVLPAQLPPDAAVGGGRRRLLLLHVLAVRG